jgi:hypothetical protein
MIEPGLLFNIVMGILAIACITIAFGFYVIPLLVVCYVLAGSMARSGGEE